MADSKDDSKQFWFARQSRCRQAGGLAGQARGGARRLISCLNGGPLIRVLQWNSSRRASTKTARVPFVPTYGFQCPACGRFDVIRPMADASAPATCPTCGQDGRRTFGAPALRALAPDLRRALDAGARSADAPEVVTTVPGRSRRSTPITTDPRHARLPRP